MLNPGFMMELRQYLDIPNPDVVDWILVELRDATDAANGAFRNMVARQAALLLNNGKIVGIDGTSLLQYDVQIDNQVICCFDIEIIWL